MSAESDLAPVLHIERELRHLSVELTQAKPGECLHCYGYRMLEFGCTGLRWAVRYRDLKPPRATALAGRLMSKGAGCDCEIGLWIRSEARGHIRRTAPASILLVDLGSGHSGR
jgi:hypothetical protein